MIGIFPGRFQPFHNGHLMVVQGMMKACSQVYIVICHGEDDMAYSVDQVREMISSSLLREDIVDANIVLVEDGMDDPEWADRVLEVCGWPEGGVIWSGRDEVRAMFEENGVETKRIVHVPGIEGEEIQNMIASGDRAWMQKVPGGTLDVVDAMMRGDGEE